MEIKKENCPCYERGIHSFDGCPYTWCSMHNSCEFDCDECEFNSLEKQQAVKIRNLEQELVERKIDYNKLNKLETENSKLIDRVKQLENEIAEKDKLIQKREHNVADFAVENSRFVKDLRRK